MKEESYRMARCRLCHAYHAVNAEGLCRDRCAKNRAARRALRLKHPPTRRPRREKA